MSNSYPDKPKVTDSSLFFHNCGYAPATFHRWEWSDTFGKWSALVTFKDGWHGFTYVKQI